MDHMTSGKLITLDSIVYYMGYFVYIENDNRTVSKENRN